MPKSRRTETQVENTPSQALGKRKRKQPAPKLVPDAQQIFKKLCFFYIPNNDTSPTRREKISRALAFGAAWKREWDNTVTHVVVDKDLTFKDALAFLELSTIPSDVVFVNDTFPTDCIRLKTILDSDQHQYLVKGQQIVSACDTEHREAAEATPCPPIKPDKSRWARWGLPAPKETPPRSDGSTQTASQALVQHGSPVLSSSFGSGSGRIPVPSPFKVPDTAKREMAKSSPGRSVDPLDEAIKEIQSISHLPVDDDDDDVSPRDCPVTDGSPTTDGRSSVKKAFDSTFLCARSGTAASIESNPNARTISVLQEMANYYERTNDTWRVMAYRKATAALRRQDRLIATAEEALALPAIGERLADKIQEIVTTNQLRKLESAKADPSDQILQKFINIYGVGAAQAAAWVRQGFTTLDDLRARAKLTPNQQIGLAHYDDFLARIPRAEVTALGDVVCAAARALDPAVQVIVGGSYRRGAPDSGDIDCILTKPGTTCVADLAPFFRVLLAHLRETRFLVAALNTPPWHSMWHGCCVLPGDGRAADRRSIDSRAGSGGIWRRIDLLLVPDAELGAALIYFTGNDIFNRSLRLLARKRGMALNQRGLYRDVLRQRGTRGLVKATRGTLVEGRDERRIFEILGVPWRPPEERVC